MLKRYSYYLLLEYLAKVWNPAMHSKNWAKLKIKYILRIFCNFYKLLNRPKLEMKNSHVFLKNNLILNILRTLR